VKTALPYILVAPEDQGGQFDPHTPGTRTSGLQEALDCAHRECRDVYIAGGRGGLHRGEGVDQNLYYLDETLRVPWSQDFRLDGGNYLLVYRPAQGSALHLDSQMNGHYRFGLVCSNSPDPVVLVRPQTSGPDDFAVFTASRLEFSAIVSAHPQGVGLQLDSSQGMIVNSRVLAEEINAAGTGLYLSDGQGQGRLLGNNQVEILYGNQYHAGDHCTGLRLGDPGSRQILDNHLSFSLHAPRGAYFDAAQKVYQTRPEYVPEQALGAQLSAQRNELRLSFYGRRAPGHDLVFEAEARENAVYTFALPNGLTSRARIPTNRVVLNHPPGFSVATPPVPPSGSWALNTTCFRVQVLITESGQVSSWTLAEAEYLPASLPHNLSLVDNLRHPPRPVPLSPPPESQTIHSFLFPGQTFVLEPGEKVQFTYSQPPVWRWKGVN
jgi:hypothetical protein